MRGRELEVVNSVVAILSRLIDSDHYSKEIITNQVARLNQLALSDGRMNWCGGVGMLTDEQRKLPFEKDFGRFTFKTCLDLSEPIEVTPLGAANNFTIDNYEKAICQFTAYWTSQISRDINGFNLYHIKFVRKGFTLHQKNK